MERSKRFAAAINPDLLLREMKKGIKVLSLFDGISCGMVALERAGIQVDRYVAYEIDKYAIEVSKKNHPRIEHMGDVTKADFTAYKDFDLVIGGSPCQGFSFAGKQLNFRDPRSKLFFEFVRALNQIKPKYFLLENVKMKKEYENVITQQLGVEPIEINSRLVSAQNRVRLYWTNIPGIIQPEDRCIGLADILENVEWIGPGAIRGRRLNKATILGRRINQAGHRQDYDKNIPIVQCLEVRKSNTDKSNCLTTVDKDNVLTPLSPGRYQGAFSNELPYRYYTVKEYCRLQTLPDNYVDIISVNQGKKCLGNCWTVDVIVHILSALNCWL